MFLNCVNCSQTPLIEIDNLKFKIKCSCSNNSLSDPLNKILSDKINYLCKEHNRAYEYYCLKHSSDLCKRCKKLNHNNCEEIIDYDDIMNENEEVKKQFSGKLDSIEKTYSLTEKIFKNLANMKNIIKKVIEKIYKIYDNFEKFFNRIKIQNKFNNIVFNSYDRDKCNYNSYLNLNKIKDYKEETIEFQKSLNTNDICDILKLIDQLK